ncbi:UDP-galactose transmembrane transporter [Aureococcus anophagefferens]|nr:UDP-galactose transmembrane transporter [Aureococcus anophagefferens]
MVAMSNRHGGGYDRNPREPNDSDGYAKDAEAGVEESKQGLLEPASGDDAASAKPAAPTPGAKHLAFCFVGLQASYLTWGYVQEKVMTRVHDGRFRRRRSASSATASSRSSSPRASRSSSTAETDPAGVLRRLRAVRVLELAVAARQYQALRHVSFPLQTISKSTKVIPVMLMGKFLNKKTYPPVDYVEALCISLGVCVFSLANLDDGALASGGEESEGNVFAAYLGVAMLALYVVSDSFTSQWQSRLYQAHPNVDQFQMMFAVNSWAICMTLFALVSSGELWTTLKFLSLNPAAFVDNVTIAITSATGQLFIFYTIKTFGPVVFTIIMTTRQMFHQAAQGRRQGQTLRAEGALMAATVKLSPAPAPYLLLVADEGDDAPEGYRRLAHCGYAAECAVRPLAAASPPA